MLANVPHAQLPDTISPKNYRIDMMIDPQDEGMSGTVAIDVTMNDATDKIWLHAKEMTVSAARIDYKDGTSTELKFHAIPLKDAPSGIAYLRAGKTLPAGDGTITIEYTTPYNQNLNSAYQVRRGDEAYIVSSFQTPQKLVYRPSQSRGNLGQSINLRKPGLYPLISLRLQWDPMISPIMVRLRQILYAKLR